MPRPFDIVGIGVAVYDTALQVEHYPQEDTKIDALEIWKGGGGPVPTALITLAKWGLRTAYIGRAGDDLWGQAIREEMSAAGVNVDYFELDGSLDTPQASIWVGAGTGSRTAVLGSDHYSQPRNLPAGIIENATMLHFDARDPEVCRRAAQIARNSGVTVSLDVGSPRVDVKPILPLVHHLVVAERFARAITGETEPTPMLDKLWHPDYDALVITFGTRGALGRNATDAAIASGSYQVETVDTTGAGDIYHAGYLYGALHGWTLPRRMRFAAAAGALAATALGARGCLPSRAQVESLAAVELPAFRR